MLINTTIYQIALSMRVSEEGKGDGDVGMNWGGTVPTRLGLLAKGVSGVIGISRF